MPLRVLLQQVLELAPQVLALEQVLAQQELELRQPEQLIFAEESPPPYWEPAVISTAMGSGRSHGHEFGIRLRKATQW